MKNLLTFLMTILLTQLSAESLPSNPPANYKLVSQHLNKKKPSKKSASQNPPKLSFSESDFQEYLLPGSQKVQINDWLHPTMNDYRSIQEYLSHAPRTELAYTNFTNTTWRAKRIRNFKLFSEREDPEFHTLYLNGDPSNKTNCIVTYISYNGTYKKGLLNLLKDLETIGFNGHVIYRIGGWPDLEEGSLEFFDVPYAFKVFSLLEAKRLGYKNCLWIDVVFRVLKPLDMIFEHIDHFGGYFQVNPTYSYKDHIQELATKALGYSLDDFLKLPAITATIVGVNCLHPKGEAFLHSWHETVKNKLGFLSFVPEQAPLSAIADQLDLWEFGADRNQCAYSPEALSEETFLFWDRQSVK